MMEMNPYEYDTQMPWIPRQEQTCAGREGAAYNHQRHQDLGPQQRSVDQKPKPPGRMPKARVLSLVRTFKKWLIAASLAGFVTLSGLAASHQVAATTTATQVPSGSSQIAAPVPESRRIVSGSRGAAYGSSRVRPPVF